MTVFPFIQLNDSIEFNQNITHSSNIPIGVYTPHVDTFGSIYFNKINNFEYLPEYYLLDNFEEFVLTSYKDSKKSISALYMGLKGSGKTKRAHKLALDSGMPILLINDLSIINNNNWNDVIESKYLNNWVVLIDEYEKKLEDKHSVSLLNWLDGSINTKQLFILIGNNKPNNKFSDPLVDRLSRVLWRKEFKSLSEIEVKSLITKLSVRQDKEDLLDCILGIPVLSLDNTLQIIKATNLFLDVAPEDVIMMLNIEYKPYEEYIIVDEYNQSLTYDDCCLQVSVKKDKIFPRPKHVDWSVANSFNYNTLSKIVGKPVDASKIDCSTTNMTFTRVDRNTLNVKLNLLYWLEEQSDGDLAQSIEMNFNLIKYTHWQGLKASFNR